MENGRIHSILNVLMGVSVGLCIGKSLYVFWDYRAHPALYAAQSAPWYLSICVYGGFTIAVVTLCLILKALLRLSKKT